MTSATHTRIDSTDADYVSIGKARAMLARPGQKTIPRERIFQFALTGQLELRQFASRWFARRQSVEALRDSRARSKAS